MRRARIRALAFARHRPDLREVLGASRRAAEHALAERLAAVEEQGVIRAGITPSALAVFGDAYALGLLLDDALLAPLPREEWEDLLLCALAAVVEPDAIDRVRAQLLRAAGRGPAHRGVHELAPAAAGSTSPDGRSARSAQPTLSLTEEERRVVAHAAGVLRTRGPEAVVVREVCDALGVARGWFSRRFAGREELIDLARLTLLIEAVAAESALHVAAFAGARDAASLAAALGAIVDRSTGDAFLVGAWDRLELLAVARPATPLAQDAGAVVGAGIDAVAAAIVDAQARGVVRGDVSARALARFLWTSPVAFVLGEVSGVPGDELRVMARRTDAMFLA